MPDLTIAQRFGTNVNFDGSYSLTLNLNDLSTIMIDGIDYGLDVSAMTDANKDEYAAKILWTLLLKSQSEQAESNNDETVKLYVTNQGKRNAVRNGVSQFAYQLVANAYKNDTLGFYLDPDEMV